MEALSGLNLWIVSFILTACPSTFRKLYQTLDININLFLVCFFFLEVGAGVGFIIQQLLLLILFS